MVNRDHSDVPSDVEGPQKYDWAHVPTKHGFAARLVLPFVSTRYKTDVTMHCLLRALNNRVVPAEEEGDELIQSHPELWKSPVMKRTFELKTFFSLYYANFQRAAPLLFRKLRKDVFVLDEEHYQQQFEEPLRPVDGLGFSGSLFFYTHDRSLIIKSIGRKFEYSFLYDKMLEGYTFYVSQNPAETLLSHMTDVLYTFDHRLGGWLGASPAHYMVMTNVLEGLDKDNGCRKWDLKPQSFFEPTRDLVPDSVKTEAAKSGLADELDEEIVLTRMDKLALMQLLESDTGFLRDMQTIDYSLLLGRYPIEMFHSPRDDGVRDPMVLPDEGSRNFTQGVRSADGKWVYKMCLLDFLWNVEQLRPKVMKTAGKLLPEQTVTTEPDRYRQEFLNMVEGYIVVWDEQRGAIQYRNED